MGTYGKADAGPLDQPLPSIAFPGGLAFLCLFLLSVQKAALTQLAALLGELLTYPHWENHFLPELD